MRPHHDETIASSGLLTQVHRLAKEELRVALEAVDSAIAEYEAVGMPAVFADAIADLRTDRETLLAQDAECDAAYRKLAERLPS
jgi:hypothetical protein